MRNWMTVVREWCSCWPSCTWILASSYALVTLIGAYTGASGANVVQQLFTFLVSQVWPRILRSYSDSTSLCGILWQVNDLQLQQCTAELYILLHKSVCLKSQTEISTP
jgi:hypothetical protein